MKTQTKENHIKLWDGIVKTFKSPEFEFEYDYIDPFKREIFDELFPGIDILHSCWLCQEQLENSDECIGCVLYVEDEGCYLYGLLDDAFEEKNLKKCIELSEQIRDIVL